MFLTFCQAADFTNIQNNKFESELRTFSPKNLIRDVCKDISDRLDFTVKLQQKPLSLLLKGDGVRLKYVLACLVRNTIERNRKAGELGIIQVFSSVKDEEVVELFGEERVEVHGRRVELVLRVVDYGKGLTKT